MWIEPAHRGRGIGRALLQHIIDWAHRQGMDHVELEVLPGNAAALGLYNARGFTTPSDPASGASIAMTLTLPRK